jgi:hypothetical protein
MARVSALLLLVAGPAVAQRPPAPAPLDPEPTTPYTWRVLVRFDPSPYFPPAFRQQVLKDVHAALAPPLGQVGQLTVADLGTLKDPGPLATAFLKDGWSALDAKPFRVLTGEKTHFLRLTALRDGTFQLACRQHDGSTGLATPGVRTRTTRDPQTVGRMAGLMLDKEFGPTGTVEKIPDKPDQVRVRFRAGKLPGFDRYVQAGDVFAVSVIQQPTRPAEKAKGANPPAPRTADPRPYTLLRADSAPADGACLCRVLTRFEVGLPEGRGVAGFRCLKLATEEAPVEVRVVDAGGGPPPASNLLSIRGTDSAFDVPPDPRDNFDLRDGVFRSGRPLKGIAYVTVGLGPTRAERFPVPVLGQGPIVLRFDVNQEQAQKARFLREVEDFRGRVAEVRTAQAGLALRLFKLIDAGNNTEALAQAVAGLDSLSAADRELSADLERLKKDPAAADPTAAGLLAGAERVVGEIRADRGKVTARVDDLKKAVAALDDPVRFEREFRAKELAARIKEYLDLGDVPAALDLYDQLAGVTKAEETKAQKAKLEAEWQPKSEAHKQARAFVADTWRRGPDTLPAFEDALEKLGPAVEVMLKHDDRFGLRGVLASFEPAVAKLKEIVDALDPNTEADKPKFDTVKEVRVKLEALDKKVRDGIRSIEAALGVKKEDQ